MFRNEAALSIDLEMSNWWSCELCAFVVAFLRLLLLNLIIVMSSASTVTE
jgi:hypothetical protein